MVIRSEHRELWIENAMVSLTPCEYRLLWLLASHPNRAFSRREIVDAVRGDDCPSSIRSVDVQVNGLRKKLGKYASRIETVRAIGYRFQPPVARE